MTVLVVPGAVGNTNPARAIFDNPFAHGCSADVQSCVPTGALNAQAQSAAAPAAPAAQVQPAVPQLELSGSSWVPNFPQAPPPTISVRRSEMRLMPLFKLSIRLAGQLASLPPIVHLSVHI